jgi:hypothetical protein
VRTRLCDPLDNAKSFGEHQPVNDCCVVWPCREEPNSVLCILLQVLHHPGRESQHKLPAENTEDANRNSSLVCIWSGFGLRDDILWNEHVPLHIVVAEIRKDECLNDFGKKNHWWPQTVAQSSQQTATSIQDLQNRVIEAYVSWTDPEKKLGFWKIHSNFHSSKMNTCLPQPRVGDT